MAKLGLAPYLDDWSALFTLDGAAVLARNESYRRFDRLILPLSPRPVRLGSDQIDWRWTARAPQDRPRIRATLVAPNAGELLLTVEHVGGDAAFLLRGLLRPDPALEPVWVALGTLEPGAKLVRHLRGPAPAAGATLALADQWDQLAPIPVQLGDAR